MNDEISTVILTELQGLRKDVTDGFSETKQRLTAIETQTDPFFANDGGLSAIKSDIADIQKTKYYVLGGAGVLTAFGNWFMHKMHF